MEKKVQGLTEDPSTGREVGERGHICFWKAVKVHCRCAGDCDCIAAAEVEDAAMDIDKSVEIME